MLSIVTNVADEEAGPLAIEGSPKVSGSGNDVRQSLGGIPAADRHNGPTVEAAIAAVVKPHGATVEVSTANSVLGAAIERDRDHDCVLVRIAGDIEIWRPASVYRLYGQPGETSCTGAAAIAKQEQQPPH